MHTARVNSAAAPSLAELLALEQVDRDLFWTTASYDDPQGLYGGQVLAQALRAASGTVGQEFLAHSLHGYFVRPGDAMKPVVFQVHRDRDGRSYAARRVVAVQGGNVLLNLSCSFHRPEAGPDRQTAPPPPALPPDELGAYRLSTRAHGIDFRDADPDSDMSSPSRVWARVVEPVADDPHLYACMITYISDMCTGLFRLADFDRNVSLTSVDHALWLYRQTTPGWLLMDLEGESVANGRGLYRGRIYDEAGRLIAGLAQESLFRKISSARPNTIRRIPEVR